MFTQIWTFYISTLELMFIIACQGQNLCKPKTKIGFMKTHKTGGR